MRSFSTKWRKEYGQLKCSKMEFWFEEQKICTTWDSFLFSKRYWSFGIPRYSVCTIFVRPLNCAFVVLIFLISTIKQESLQIELHQCTIFHKRLKKFIMRDGKVFFIFYLCTKVGTYPKHLKLVLHTHISKTNYW